MKTVQTIKLSEAEILRIKREGQIQSRQLVKDAIRTQESMFLIPPEVTKASKVRCRGFLSLKSKLNKLA